MDITSFMSPAVKEGTIKTVEYDEYLQELEDKTERDAAIMTEGMVRVPAVDIVVNKIKGDHKWMTIIGCAGQGKTTLGYMVLKSLKGEGFRIFKIETPKDYFHVVRKTKKSVIMLNDIFGTFSFDSSQLTKWEALIRDIRSPDDKGNQTGVLLICRTNILQSVKQNLGRYSNIFPDTRVLDLTASETQEERTQILEHYVHRNNLTIPKQVVGGIAVGRTPHGFPHCCRLFVELVLKGVKLDVVKFFKSPLWFLDQNIYSLIQNPTCLSLFKRMLKAGGRIDADKEKEIILKSAEIHLISTFVKISRVITFTHPSIYESVIHVIGAKDKLFLVQNASISVLMQKVSVLHSGQENQTGFVNVYPEDDLTEILASRFQSQIAAKDFSVFTNSRLCENAAFCEELVKNSIPTSGTVDKKSKLWIDDLNPHGQTMLLTAFASGNYSAARVLLENGADANKMGKCGRTALYYPCQRGPPDVMVIEQLIKHGASVNDVLSEGWLPLHYLCSRDVPDVAAVELLLKHGSNVNKTDCCKKTGLHYLCSSGHPSVNVIQRLINDGADVNSVDSEGQTVLHYLCARDPPDVDVVRVVVTHGADVNISDSKGMAVCHYLCCLDHPDVSVLRLLLHHGADVDKSDRYRKTALHYLCSHENVDVCAVELLVNHGAKVDKTDCDGWTPFHILCRHIHPDVRTAELLIKYGADVNRAGMCGWIALHELCSRDQPDLGVIEALLRHGADVNILDDHVRTPLHWLCISHMQNVDAAELLIKHGADVNISGWYGQTALHYACCHRCPNYSVIDMLIKHGANVNKLDYCGKTARQYLSRHGSPCAVVIGLLSKQNVNTKNKK